MKMKHFSFTLLAFSSISLHLFSLFAFNSLCFVPNTAFVLGNETDYLALSKFKQSIFSDPYGIFSSWNSSTHFCNWLGITCNPIFQRVTELNLPTYKLEGSISPHIGNLSFLRNLNLANNSFYGEIPQEVGRLSQLQQLHIQNNSLVGKIPTNLTGCTDLKHLYLYLNYLVGNIPIEIRSLKKLQHLNVALNQLTGVVPSFIGNLSSLTMFSISRNNLKGNIPQEICSLKSLTFIALAINNLTGIIPSCLYNMSSLTDLSVTANQFYGSLPPNMFNMLLNLQVFECGGNQISRSIPFSITNASMLSILDIGTNYFIGKVPSLGKLQNLRHLSLSINNLGYNSINDLKFLKSLINCSKLEHLDISSNNFGGHLPNFIGNFSSQLHKVYIGGNQITGKIPIELGNLVNLFLLTMEGNHFEGIIPTTFGKLQNLRVLRLRSNNLSGDIPTFIGNLTLLFHLSLGDNMLEGIIPPSIGDCQMLQYLDLPQNLLKGTIPLEIFNLSFLMLDLSKNSLSGNIPKEVGTLKHINLLDVSENNLFGDIPETIGECMMMEYLYLQGNFLQGVIPTSLASLKVLTHLDLSRNNLTGLIPHVLQSISSLQYFNVSFNMLNGEVPSEGVFRNVSGLVVTGNNNLCGGILELHLPPCLVKYKKHAKHNKFKLVGVIVSVIVCLLMLSIILTIYWMRKRTKKSSLDSPTIDQMPKVSYQTLHNGTNGFSTTNLIGSGNFSSVYKGIIELEENFVAIKVLKLEKKGAHKSFIAECNALKNIKHRNLVQIFTCCSSIDYKGQEFKALIFEYMRNGSLEQWMHPMTLNVVHSRTLNLGQRLNIMIDVASALHYLHHECEQSIIHCDLKPSNVLLNDNMVAHVSDFGIARLLSTINGKTSKQTSTIGIKGTIGYAPPEYGMGSEVSTYGDVYSFGILILEMLCGKRPTDEMFEDGKNLQNFVVDSFPDNVQQILDPRLISTFEGNYENLDPNVDKCLVSLFKIGLACSMESPKERMNMINITRELNQIKKVILIGVDDVGKS